MSTEFDIASAYWWDGELVCESVGKADVLFDHFDGKQSRESVDVPLTCHPSPGLITFAFRSRKVRRLLLDKELPMLWPPVLLKYFCGLVVWEVFRLVADTPMSLQF